MSIANWRAYVGDSVINFDRVAAGTVIKNTVAIDAEWYGWINNTGNFHRYYIPAGDMWVVGNDEQSYSTYRCVIHMSGKKAYVHHVSPGFEIVNPQIAHE